MIELLHNIAQDDNGSPIGFLIFVAFIVITSIIGALSKAVSKSRQRGGQQLPGGAQPTGRGAGRRPTVDEFLNQIRRMAKGQAGPTGGREPSPREPLSRPAPPLQATGGPGVPPPPPRPMRPRPAGGQPMRAPAPPSRPVQPGTRPIPRRVEPVPMPAPVSRPPEPAIPAVTAGPRDAMEQLGALAERPQRPPTAAPPKRRVRPKPKTTKAPKPVLAPASAGPADLRAALRQRLAAGPIALREAIVLGEVLGRPISMRRHHVRRPGSVGRLI